MSKQIIVGIANRRNHTGKVDLTTAFIEHMAVQSFTPTGENFYTGWDLMNDPYGPVGFIGPCPGYSNGASQFLATHGWVGNKFGDFYEVVSVWLLKTDGARPIARTLSVF